MSTESQPGVTFQVLDYAAARKVWQRQRLGGFTLRTAQPGIEHQIYIDTPQFDLLRQQAWMSYTYVDHTLVRMTWQAPDGTLTHHAIQEAPPTIQDLLPYLQPLAVAAHTLSPILHRIAKHRTRQVWSAHVHVADLQLISGLIQRGDHSESFASIRVSPMPHSTVEQIAEIVSFCQTHLPVINTPSTVLPLSLEYVTQQQHTPVELPHALQQHVVMLLGSKRPIDYTLFIPLRHHDSSAMRIVVACVIQQIHQQPMHCEPFWLASTATQHTLATQISATCPPIAASIDGWPIDYRALPFGEMLRMHLRQQYRKVLHRRHDVLQAYSAHDIHRMRVALRKLLALLDCAESMYDEEHIRQYRRGFRRIARFMGVIRDCDTLADNVVRILGAHHVPDVITRNIAHKRQQSLAQLDELLRHPKHLQFLHDFATFTCTPEQACVVASLPLTTALGERILFRLNALQASPVRSWEKADDEELHELRIRGKRLRYIIESFPDVFVQEHSPVLDTLSRFQEHLGVIQDAVVTQQLLTDLKLATHPDAKRVLSEIRAEAQTYRKQIRLRWEEITHPTFTTAVHELIATLDPVTTPTTD